MQAVAFLVTLLLPVLLVLYIRYENQKHPSQSAAKKKKKSKKKTSSKPSEFTTTPSAVITNVNIPDPQAANSPSAPKEPKSAKRVAPVVDVVKEQEVETKKPAVDASDREEHKDQAPSFVHERTKKAAVDSAVSRMTIDEHMDTTPRFSRVMRIKTDEPEEDKRYAPLEPGWSRAAPKVRSSPQIASTNSFEPLTKKQRENQAKARKKKEEKAALEAEQEARLRQHKRELEKIKINEFYSKGAGKKIVSQSSVWGNGGGSGTPGSGKRPQGVASLNEHGHLIWD